jgi:hypothetical protein
MNDILSKEELIELTAPKDTQKCFVLQYWKPTVTLRMLLRLIGLLLTTQYGNNNA